MGLLAATVFAETGLLFGFFLPGDSLLVVSGIFAAAGELDLVRLNLTLMAAAILGDTVGYQLGSKTGPKIFTREDSLFFKKSHLIRTHEFYERHGAKTIILARFLPILRTFAPVLAGVGTMSYARFLSYNVLGGVAWVASMTLTGYGFARLDPHLDRHLRLVKTAVTLVPILLGVAAFVKERGHAEAIQE